MEPVGEETKKAKAPVPAEQSQPKSQKPHAPPAIITVDTKGPGKEADGGGDSALDEAASSKASSDLASQAQTPKHANTIKEANSSANKPKASLFNGAPPAQNKDPRHAGVGAGNGPPAGASGGAFQPRDRSGYPPMPPGHGHPQGLQQVSPTGSGTRFYPAFSNPPARFNAHYDFPRFNQAPTFHQQDPYRGHPPPMFPMRPYPPAEFQGRQHHWAGPPSFAVPGRMHMMPGASNPSNTVSRAVSSSFDRSIKSRDDSNAGKIPVHAAAGGAPAGHDDDHGSVGDASWKMLKQVHSVDEEEMRKRASKVALDHRPGSNSSSLTNSPTDEMEGKKVTTTTKQHSSLDSLSSVASAQEPIDTSTKVKAPSPSNSTGSLDLMKCPSGSSALLLPAHQRNLSQFSFPPHGGGAKRPHEEARHDADTAAKDDSAELRRPPSSDEPPPAKKGRLQAKDAKKASPLSITCSPPNTPTQEKTKSAAESKVHQPKPVYPKKEDSSPGFYDQPPSYSYSLDSAVPREAGLKPASSHLRPGSSASSTATPMQVEGNGAPPSVGQLPSWEIHPQDSFGGTSVNAGNGLMSSFSFVQEYPMLPSSGSGEVGTRPRTGSEVALESRNPSFDAGHGYAGNIGRSDSMMSYDRHGPYDGRTGYPGQFPPAAPSWGSAGSYATAPAPSTAPPVYGMIRNSTFPSMVRNYSEDSGARTSPAPGSSGPGPRAAALPPSFQPPPEFRAPPTMMSKGTTQNTIITSPYNPTPKTGPFGWTKEEDNRLTEIMKKFKNPRDWEPIAKEHSRGRSAKECHERWIRYLKPGVRKGQWTDHEDAIVMEVVSNSSEQPFTRWSDLAQRLPGRVGKQIRDRWVNHLNPAINHLPFSREDDMKLWNGHKQLGKRWVEIATKCFNSTRSENHIKNRWYSASFKKFITNEFGLEAYLGTVKNKGKKNNGKALPDSKKHRKPGTPGSPRRRVDSSGKFDPSQVEAV